MALNTHSSASDLTMSSSTLKSKDVFQEEGINKISSLVNHQKIAEIKGSQIESSYRSLAHKQISQENMKNQEASNSITNLQRAKSNDKTNLSHGSTGGSQSFTATAIVRKPTLRLNTNLINSSSSNSTNISVPQSTSNNHSSRMLNYQQPSSTQAAQQNYRTSITSSTPKNQSSSVVVQQPNQNYTASLLVSKHRPQISNSLVKQGTQGSQQSQQQISSNLQQFNPAQSNSSDVVKVGTSVPKTTTAANLKNFNNLRQFNQLFNQNKSISQQQNVQNAQCIIDNNKQFQDDSQQKQPSLLQLHSKHTQQLNNISSSKCSSLSKIKQQFNTQSDQDKQRTGTTKNLQISIPSSPRHTQDNNIEDSKQSVPLTLHPGSLSTKNGGNQGQIKLNKFSCHSTRHASQKQNIFSQPQPSDKQESAEPVHNQLDSSNPDAMPLQPAHKIIIPNHESTKHSLKRNGVVRAYAANTNQGLVRNYNEDRVSIILNILKPPNRQAEHWPRCSFFGIYDGHGGAACADFLRDNLHQFVIKEQSFPSNPKEALKNGFANAEKKFIEHCQTESGIIDKSGSCAIVVLIVEDMCYVANVGDSRAILSSEEGKRIFPLSRDHKPCDELERKRIIDAGGQIYHRTATAANDANNPNKKEVIVGPLRVLPGRLSVSRTFGDAEAKLAKFGGNPNVVIATPEIKSFKITKEHDFIVLGCDGIFDKLSNQDTIKCVWNSVTDSKSMNIAQNIHKQSGLAVEYILKNSLLRRTLDNVTVVMIAFNNFKHAVFGSSKQSSKENRSKVSQQSSQVSIDNGSMVSLKKKENIPPSLKESSDNEKQTLQSSKAFGNRLQIDTNQNCSNQGLKTTTNAQLNRENSMSQYEKPSSRGPIQESTFTNNKSIPQKQKPSLQLQTSSNGRSKHFDFTNV